MKRLSTLRCLAYVFFSFLFAIVGFAFAQEPQRASTAAKRPNIVFLLADDLGYGDLGCYGQAEIKTPNIDRLAAGGMRFTQFYAGCTVCAPSRCALMTGYHTGHCRVRGNEKNELLPDDTTIASVLKSAGYATGLCGKWGLGSEGSMAVPTKKGFDYFYGYLDQHHAHNYYPAYLFRNEERVPLKNVVPGSGPFGSNVATVKAEYSHDLIANEALEFINRNREHPFFLYVAFTIPHANNENRPNGMEVPDYGTYADRNWPATQKGLAAMISRMDADVGRIIARLKELGLSENTLVLFSSDNGPHHEGGNDPKFNHSSGPLRGTKRDLYEGGVRVPLVAYWPASPPVPPAIWSAHFGISSPPGHASPGPPIVCHRGSTVCRSRQLCSAMPLPKNNMNISTGRFTKRLRIRLRQLVTGRALSSPMDRRFNFSIYRATLAKPPMWPHNIPIWWSA